jgi:DNA polymerase-1
MKKTLLVFDFNNLLMRGLSVHPGLEFAGKPTGGFFGFLNQFCSQINNHKPSDVVICNDYPPYLRKELQPEYKADRKPLEPDVYEILKLSRIYCRDFINLLGINLYEEKGHEADDLIAIICDEYSYDYNKIVIISNDSDLYQLFKFPNVYLQKGKVSYSRKDFEKDYPGISIRDWIWIKAMAGTHNGIKGLHRVGDITAIKILKDEDRFSEIKKEHGELLDLNRRLIKLPFINDIELSEINKPNFSMRKVIMYLSNFGIKFQGNFKNALETL